MSKHPQYRLNLQYLFYLLNNANIRQLSCGIYHKMNVTNPRLRYTAAEYLEAMSKELLESNLNTIFSTLRNTEQYWRKPRSDLNCMTQHYGPATWFLTLRPSEWLWDDLGEYLREVNKWNDSSTSYLLVYLLLKIQYQHQDFLIINFMQCLTLFVQRVIQSEK